MTEFETFENSPRVKMAVLWDIIPFILIEIDRRLRDSYLSVTRVLRKQREEVGPEIRYGAGQGGSLACIWN
jgi:hypothetical protein